ncbi:Lytic transglycosylase catalytic [Bacteroides coprosuis DSM 18011]|uniref:Lytic transglycosylase catalytic n=1 Tax=Bacteroides coprosuis DSM 18011 TaxID=679937 RepID=F3ZTI3_9BACE|nr:Lytic transglycosylase catalytic [Bacteroides coprosuis DSM 18011]
MDCITLYIIANCINLIIMKINKKQGIISFTLVTLLIATPVLIGSTVQFNKEDQTLQSQGITPPSVPDQANFAGETVDLRRMDLRERMDRELMAFSYMHTSSILMVKRANRYFPVIEPILKANKIPDDLKYLMVIESSLNPLAMSPAGAAGFWQFMKGTGRDYGLEVNNNIDERYNIEKSTKAACSYLLDAYKKYGDWITAAASYNAGQGRITNELSRQDVDHAADLWLVQETSRYMFRLLAAKQFLENPKQFGFFLKREHLYPPIHYKYVSITYPISDLVEFAKKYNINYAQLKEANPWLRGRNLENKSGRTYIISIPTTESLTYNPKHTPIHNKNWIVD